MLVHRRKEPAFPSRVVLLGAGGFVAPALAKGLEAYAVKVLALGSAALDLSDPASVLRLGEILRADDTVVMLAALTPEKGRDTAILIRNLRMAEHVAAAVAARTFAQLIYFSSDAVYGGPASIFSEGTPASPRDLYGVMHLTRELALAEAAGKAGIPFCILRPSAIYGPGDTHNSYGPNRFIRTALNERIIRLFGQGEEIRDHVYIGDVVNLTKLTITRCSSGVLNLVSGQAISFAELAASISRMTGGESSIESLPRNSAVTHRPFDPTAIGKSFPEFRSTPLETGLRDTIVASSRE